MQTYIFSNSNSAFLVEAQRDFPRDDLSCLEWLLQAEHIEAEVLEGFFIGPRREMVTPWSTNATDICSNAGISGVCRIESFSRVSDDDVGFDPMLQARYRELSAGTLVIEGEAEQPFSVTDIRSFNTEFGLALSDDEIQHLESASKKIKRHFTDSELFGFAQINSEHCRHKIFNGRFIIDGQVQDKSLFAHIKHTSKVSPKNIVSAYSDNVAFVRGPHLYQFSSSDITGPGIYGLNSIDTVISLKAETHNFPTTVEPFYGASTGSGGEIRDRMAGGMGSIPLAGSAVYMTAYPRLGGSHNASWESKNEQRKWKYQSPSEILVKASNGASDFGNKFGQPLIVGSVLTFECSTSRAFYGYDRAVMLAGGVGYANALHAFKSKAAKGDVLVLLGGDNYRIGMAGGSVSSVDTGAYSRQVELSAVQRANPEMQKRVFNVIRALVEQHNTPIKLIHDHGAGGHVNCFSELLEPLGGRIELSKLPIGDPTLSVREIICNESQERMGLIVGAESVELLKQVAKRERAPVYVVGKITGEESIEFIDEQGGKPVELPLDILFGSSPKTELYDKTVALETTDFIFDPKDDSELRVALQKVLSLESVACKDWLTNKVDRSVTGRVALQQCAGPLGLPLNDVGVVAVDYSSNRGVASSIGHAPIAGIISQEAGAVLSVAEALTNIVWAPLVDGLDSVALSANWMWPAKQPGEDVRLYRAVEAMANFAAELGIPIPTGKDSLSMTMNYEDGLQVRAPGTVVVSAAASVTDVSRCVSADIKQVGGSKLVYINFSEMTENPLGASALVQTFGELGSEVPTVRSAQVFKETFNCLQELIKSGHVVAGHDVSSGGLVVTLCEMAFGGYCGLDITVDGDDALGFLFSEKPGVVVQVLDEDIEMVLDKFKSCGVSALILGQPSGEKRISIKAGTNCIDASVDELLRVWFKSSYLLDSLQTKRELASERFDLLGKEPLSFSFPKGFVGRSKDCAVDVHRSVHSGLVAAVTREQGTNGDREMAFSLFAAGFDVRDVTMSDLVEGREDLNDVRLVAFPGGFSSSDVLGAGRGWAGAFRYNERAYRALRKFYERPDTLSLGVCNGCQLMIELDLLQSKQGKMVTMAQNESEKFESSFLAVDVVETKSVLLKSLIGTRLGVWVAHGEGRFSLPEGEEAYDIALKYVSSTYPANPNGSDFNAAGIVSEDGRHLAMMPHIERCVFPWNWAYYPCAERKLHEVSPWILAFVNAREWLLGKGSS